MPLNLNELIKKATEKGIKFVDMDNETSSQVLRPWQQESTLFTSHKKSATNRQQTDNKLATNRQQTDNKPTTNRQHQGLKKKETDNKLATQPTTQPTTNWQQTDNKPTTKYTFSSLVGLQRTLMIFIYNECKTARSRSTENLTLEYISRMINSPAGCIKTTLQRLELKEFIERIEHKNGRGGWSRYSIPDQHFQKILQYETDNKLATNWQQTGNKLATQPTTQPTTNRSSSSSNIINTTTTSEPQNSPETILPAEWQTIDIEPLVTIGFTKTHLSQIESRKKLKAETVQDSIYAFAFDLQENNKATGIKGDPINFFMGILRNDKPYLPPSNYESPQDRAMRLYSERKREIEQKRISLEKEAMTFAYKDWFFKLTDEQKLEFLPISFRHSKAKLNENKILESAARGHFEAEIWPIQKNELFHEANVESKEVVEEN